MLERQKLAQKRLEKKAQDIENAKQKNELFLNYQRNSYIQKELEIEVLSLHFPLLKYIHRNKLEEFNSKKEMDRLDRLRK